MTDFIIHHGLPLLFAVVMIESFGIPLPGETALIAFAILAAKGNYPIQLVIVLAAAGAIIGDNLGYWLIGRVGGRKLFERWNWLRKYSHKALPQSELLMSKHGGKTVFFGRFITVLRYTAAWVAGLGRMPWWKFLVWNALGGVVWATTVGLVAYYAGQVAADAITKYGLYAALATVVLTVASLYTAHLLKKRFEPKV